MRLTRTLEPCRYCDMVLMNLSLANEMGVLLSYICAGCIGGHNIESGAVRSIVSTPLADLVAALWC